MNKDVELIRDYFILGRFTDFPYSRFENKELEALMWEIDKLIKELKESLDNCESDNRD